MVDISNLVSLTLNSDLIILQVTFTQLTGDSYDLEIIRRNVSLLGPSKVSHRKNNALIHKFKKNWDFQMLSRFLRNYVKFQLTYINLYSLHF